MHKYKLTDQQLRTYQDFQWEVGKWVKAPGPPNQPLCTNSWIHCYDSPEIAVYMNPLHADIDEPKCWRVEVRGPSLDDHGLKCGYREVRLLHEVPVPHINTEQRVEIAIRLVWPLSETRPKWQKWAADWLTGRDRTTVAAKKALAWVPEEAAAWVQAATRAAAWAATRPAWEPKAAAWAVTQAAAWAATWPETWAMAQVAKGQGGANLQATIAAVLNDEPFFSDCWSDLQ